MHINRDCRGWNDGNRSAKMFLRTANPTNATMSANKTTNGCSTSSVSTLSPTSPVQPVHMYDHGHQFSMMYMNRYNVNASGNVNNYDFQSNCSSTIASNINHSQKCENSGRSLHTHDIGARYDEISQSQLMKLNNNVDGIGGTGNKTIKHEMMEMIQGHYKTLELIQKLLNSQKS